MIAIWLVAVPIAVLSSRAQLGLAARRRGWFLIPEEVAPPAELAQLSPPATGTPDRVRPGWPEARALRAAPRQTGL